MQDISYEEISKLEDIGEFFEVAGKYDIPLEGCDSCEDFRERITLHKQKLNGHHKHVLDQHRFEKLNREHIQKRQELCNIYSTLEPNLGASYEFITRILKSRGVSDDLSNDVKDHETALRRGECNIVIAGQTSAGKSALLNLLIGKNVLPWHILSCTSSICKLRYGHKYRVKVSHMDEITERSFTSQEELSDFLDNLVFEKDITRRANGQTIPQVEIELPADILKSGVTVIDTPGFGEYEAMDELVRNFIANGRVAAFVYVVKTDSAGGVQEDRLVRFLKTFLDSHKGGDQFNHRAALFVCNRWDIIEDSQKQEVKVRVIEKLKDAWPKLHESQICFFSTTRAKASQEIDKDYITPDYHNLLSSLNSLFALAHQDSVRKSYGWMKNVLKESTMYLKTLLSQITLDEREHEDRLDVARKQLEALRTKADDVIKDLRTIHQDATRTLIRRFKQMLQSESFLQEVSQWDPSELPPMPTDANEMGKYKETIDSLIVSKILKIFDNNEECKNLIITLRHEMLSKAKKQLKLLDDDMLDISSDLSGGSIRSSVSSTRSSGSEDDSIIEYVRDRRGKGSPRSSRPLFSRIVGPFVSRAVDMIAPPSVGQRRRSQANSQNLIISRCNKVAGVLINDDELLGRVAARYTDRLERHIKEISWNIPMFIQANDTLIKETRDIRRKAGRDKEELKSAMEKLEPQKEKLRGFGELHVKDLSSSDIVFSMGDRRISSSTQYRVDTFLKHSHTDVGSRRDIVQGLWTIVQKATLTGDNVSDPVMIKTYIRQPNQEYLCREIAKIRCLEHKSIAPFLGMTHNDEQSAFVFDGHYTSARLYLRRSTVDLSKALPLFFTQLVEAMEVLHKDGMVHMELTLDTLMMNADGNVKLCNMCLPKICKLPSDIETIEAADFICLSPEVLRGSVYDCEADKYSFGLVLYEVLMPMKPYEEQRRWKLSEFVNNVHPSRMLVLDNQSVPESVTNLLRSCLLRGKGLRMPIVRIKEMIQIVFDDGSFMKDDIKNRIRRTSSNAVLNRERRHPTFSRHRSRQNSADNSLPSPREEEGGHFPPRNGSGTSLSSRNGSGNSMSSRNGSGTSLSSRNGSNTSMSSMKECDDAPIPPRKNSDDASSSSGKMSNVSVC